MVDNNGLLLVLFPTRVEYVPGRRQATISLNAVILAQ
jgi:hypothetical protein